MNPTLSTIETSFGIVNAFASFIVVLSGFLFPKLFLSVRTRCYSHILYCVSVCDMMGSIASSIGFPMNLSSFECKYQAFTHLYFYTASWFWLTLYVYQIYATYTKKHYFLNPLTLHLIGWLLPLVITLLPLSTGVTFGLDDDQKGTARCGYKDLGDKNTKFIWLSINASIGIILFCMMFLMLYKMIQDSKYQGNESQGNRLRSLAEYPVAFFFVWILSFIAFFVNLFITANTTISIADIISTTGGVVLTTLLFRHSLTLRRQWSLLIRRVGVRLSLIAQESLLKSRQSLEVDELDNAEHSDEEIAYIYRDNNRTSEFEL